MKRIPIGALCATLLLTRFATAELQLRWQVDQSVYEVGWIWLDLNNDGVRELIKEDGVGTWFFDGADGYGELWSFSDPSPQDGTTMQLFRADGDHLVFLRQNTTTQTASLRVVQALGETVWMGPTHAGNVSEAGIGDVDGDGDPDLVWSWHYWDGSDWASSWTARDLRSGAVLQAPLSMDGYLSGPWVGNIEGDGAAEVLLNLYSNDGSSSQLACYGDTDVAVAPVDVPDAPTLQAWPNPFNPDCRIALPVPSAGGELRVVDVTGRVVRTLSLAPGARLARWDGLADSGRPAASGVYWLQAQGASLPVTLLR